jgi:glutathione S-transferase
MALSNASLTRTITMKLYYSPGACSLAVHIALEEIGVAFDTECIAISDGAQLRAEYRALNPQARVPLLAWDQHYLSELMAILLFLDRRYPHAKLMPQAEAAYARALWTMMYLTNTVHIGFATIWRPERFTDEASLKTQLSAEGKARTHAHLALLEQRLPEQGWLGEDRWSVADMALLPFYRFGLRVGLPMQEFPRYTRIVVAAESEPAVQRALAREGLSGLSRI